MNFSERVLRSNVIAIDRKSGLCFGYGSAHSPAGFHYEFGSPGVAHLSSPSEIHYRAGVEFRVVNYARSH